MKVERRDMRKKEQLIHEPSEIEVEQPTDVEEVSPRNAIYLIMGRGPTVDIVNTLRGKERVFSWGDLLEEFSDVYSCKQVILTVKKLHRLGILKEVEIGMFRLTENPVSRSLKSVMREAERTHRQKILDLKPIYPTLKGDEADICIRLENGEREILFGGLEFSEWEINEP